MVDYLKQYESALLKPKIYESNSSFEDKGFVYVATPPHFVSANIYKIGKAKNIANRLSMLSTAHPESFNLFILIKTNSMKYCERDLHRMFGEHNVGHEFFELYDEDFDLIRERFLKQIVIDDTKNVMGKPYEEVYEEFKQIGDRL